ncbi:SDR family NAD(P)-dependent oxidoreductase [Pseudooceanicola sp. C21-150M6]|uniref:SDR family NAD(P)-dependent oxidoreductase n=1 Tax=Pseudooceanicola sp. C21-150M6 TaxID=3434355 RepID=UPI003D7FD5D3
MTRTALVTGGARGIGRAIALDLARDHDVAITCNSSAPDGLPEDMLAIAADLSVAGAAERVIAEVLARFGRIDVIVNNAGVIATTPKESFDLEAQRHMLDINLLAPQALLAAALPHLQAGAAIVNISSVNAVLPPRDAATYGASKAALNLWTRAMAKELGPRGIRVNAVAPGAINTPEAPRDAELTQAFVAETALGRIGRPEDIARATRFLVSDAAGFITGEVLTVSGGYRL